jgi:hypothetical protein
MKMDGNGRKNSSPVSVSVFYHRKWDQVWSSRKRDKRKTNENENTILTKTHNLIQIEMLLMFD